MPTITQIASHHAAAFIAVRQYDAKHGTELVGQLWLGPDRVWDTAWALAEVRAISGPGVKFRKLLHKIKRGVCPAGMIPATAEDL